MQTPQIAQPPLVTGGKVRKHPRLADEKILAARLAATPDTPHTCLKFGDGGGYLAAVAGSIELMLRIDDEATFAIFLGGLQELITATGVTILPQDEQ